MNNRQSNLLVSATESFAVIKIRGRANFHMSPDFKKLLEQLRKNGMERYILDAADCRIMDSTFLGILAGFSRTLPETEEKGRRVILLNPPERIIDILEGLGIEELFEILQSGQYQGLTYEEVEASKGPNTKHDLSLTSLEAHRALMDINPGNIPKFKDVARYLEEEVRKEERSGDPDGGDR